MPTSCLTSETGTLCYCQRPGSISSLFLFFLGKGGWGGVGSGGLGLSKKILLQDIMRYRGLFHFYIGTYINMTSEI